MEKIKSALAFLFLLPLLGCSQMVKADQMVHWMEVTESGGLYRCVLYSDDCAEVSAAESRELEKACEKALEGISQAEALGLLDSVILPDSIGYPELLEIAETIEEDDARMPNIHFYLSGGESPKEILEKLSGEQGARCDISRILFDNGGVVVPRLDGSGCLVCTQSGTTLLQGDNAQLAELMAGQIHSLELAELGFRAEWVTTGQEVAENGMLVQLDCIGCEVLGDKDKTAADIARQLERIVQDTGPEPYLLEERSLQMAPESRFKTDNFVCKVVIN